MFDQGGGVNGNAVAAGIILVTLIETLVDKGIISNAEVRTLLGKADEALKPKATIVSVIDARAVIAALVKHFTR